jgi:hypothetical protein
MNSIDDQLNRLFRSAAQNQPDEAAVVSPYGLETQVTAAWRAGRSGGAGFWDMALLVRGLILASLIMAVSFWPALSTTTSPFADFLQLTDSTVPADDAP